MKKIIAIIVFFVAVQAQAQKPNMVEIGVFHPVTIGDNFLEQDYNGFVGVDFKLTYAKLGPVRLKTGFDASWIKSNESFAAIDDIYKINPKLVFGVDIPLSNLEPYVNFGYSFFILSESSNSVGAVTVEENLLDGFNGGIGLTYTIKKWFYIDANYQFSKLNRENINDTFYENITVINIGIGVKI